MKAVVGWIRNNPARTLALIQLVVGGLIARFGWSPQIAAGVVGVFAILLGVGVHQLVTPVTGMVDTVTNAATSAATQTVQSLDSSIVGTVGEVTGAAQSIITGTVNRVVGGLLGKTAAPAPVPTTTPQGG